jgi:hypothetical protein
VASGAEASSRSPGQREPQFELLDPLPLQDQRVAQSLELMAHAQIQQQAGDHPDQQCQIGEVGFDERFRQKVHDQAP